MSYPKVIINEESMREGMQIESADIPVEDKIKLLTMLSETGLKRINVGSFVSARYAPQMANISEVLRGFTPKPGINYYYLAFNQMGRDFASEFASMWGKSRPLRPSLSCHMCDSFVRRNINQSRDDEIDRWPSIVKSAVGAGVTEASIGINAAWGSNFEGRFTLEQRMKVLRRAHELWDEVGITVAAISLGDPMGWNMPHVVEEQLEALLGEWPEITHYGLHLHNARGMAIPSIYVALRILDDRHELQIETTAGGIGGCPYTGMGQANGMAATEDVVHMLETMGIDTGVDLDKLIDFVWELERVLGRLVPGHTAHVGPCPDRAHLFDVNMPFVETYEEAKHFKKGPAVVEHQIRPWREPIPAPALST